MSRKSRRRAKARRAKAKEYVLNGPPCHRCGHPTEVREHSEPTQQKQLTRAYWYRRTFMCRNRGCKTEVILDESSRVYPYVSACTALDAEMKSLMDWDGWRHEH